MLWFGKILTQQKWTLSDDTGAKMLFCGEHWKARMDSASRALHIVASWLQWYLNTFPNTLINHYNTETCPTGCTRIPFQKHDPINHEHNLWVDSVSTISAAEFLHWCIMTLVNPDCMNTACKAIDLGTCCLLTAVSTADFTSTHFRCCYRDSQ